MADVVCIRDTMAIDAELTAYLYSQPLSAGSTLFLVAREIVHAPGYVLVLPGINVVVVSELYDARGGQIVAKDRASSLRLISRHFTGLETLIDRAAGRTADTAASTPPGTEFSGTTQDFGGWDGRVEIIAVTTDAPSAIGTASGTAATGLPQLSSPDGDVTVRLVTTDEYLTHVREALGPPALTSAAGGVSIAQRWAQHRLNVGTYHYRRYQPGVAGDRGAEIALAQTEFDGVIQLNSGYVDDARRLKQQIVANLNILGLPWDMDLTPDFDRYEDAFVKWGGVVATEFQGAIHELLTAADVATMKALMSVQVTAIDNEIQNIGSEIAAAQLAQKAVQNDVNDAQRRVEAVQNQINAALSEMAQHQFKIGDLIDTVASIATAAVAIVGAVETGGATLVALAPEILSLAEDVAGNPGTIVHELFTEQQPDIDRITGEYAKIRGDASEVISETRKIVNLVNSIKELADGVTPDNAEYVALVQRGIEAAQALAAARLHQQQADFAVQAVQAKQQRAQSLRADAQKVVDETQLDIKVLRAGGLAAIARIQSVIERELLLFAFFAARSAEIYTLQPEMQNVLFDAGFIRPDDESAFVEDPNVTTGLITAFVNKYVGSFNDLLQPAVISGNMALYFNPAQGGPRPGALRKSFTDPGILAEFKSLHDLPFWVPLEDLPPDHFEAKILGVAVSFVGAHSSSGVISCELRHGPRYDSLLRGGTVTPPQFLQQRVATIPTASTTELQPPPVDLTGFSTAVQRPSLDPLYGRGVGGAWGLSISPFEIDHNAVDLSGLAQIQVWIGYVFMAASG